MCLLILDVIGVQSGIKEVGRECHMSGLFRVIIYNH